MGKQYSRSHSSRFVPILLLGIAVLIWLGFQSWRLVAEHEHLRAVVTSQEQLVKNAAEFREKLNTIARETQLLAEKDNPNAKLLVEELGKRGITIDPKALPVAPPGRAPGKAPPTK